MKILNKIIAILIIVINAYFLSLSVVNIHHSGGPFGYGLLVLPISLSINLLLIPAILSIRKKQRSSNLLLFINSIGLIWAIFWFYLFVTIPIID